jgi:hypothetical protein
MKKRISANLYTETKMIWKNRDHIIIRNEDGTLFSQGQYKTKIFPSDLPEWFVKGRFYKHHGYLSASGIKYLLYDPDRFSNHMFKDDFLYISYDKLIIPISRNQSVFKFDGFDEYIWGWDIVSFLKSSERYSNYDITDIKAQIEKKRKWFETTYSEFYRLECGISNIF